MFDLKVKEVDNLKIKTQTSRRVIGLAPNQPNYRILILEDRWENSLLLHKLLQSVGFEVKSAENGRDGIALWKSWQPHLILMDLEMPIINGIEATKYIRANSKDRETIIIALTASAFAQNRVNSLASGCHDFISKPFKEDVLFQKIAQYLEVIYLYEDSSPLTSITPPENLHFKLDNLKSEITQMPKSWVEKITYFAAAADAEKILLLLQEIPDRSRFLAEAIANLVDNFYFDKIINLTQH
jgi:CheY-like chemotaxis protein